MSDTDHKLKDSDIVYDKDDYVSKPWKVKDGTVPINILKFDHSFGYNCRKYFNLCVADPETVVFSSGNLIHFFNVKTKKLSFRRGSGEGIGYIAKNPKLAHIAVGERGSNPPIIIYEWLTLKIITILKSGAVNAFSYLTYSPNGELLISQSGKPDFRLTIWEWKKEIILLQTQSYTQDVFNVRFSEYLTNHFVTCGVKHVKFWSMEHTFTGLKLEEKLGRFGNVPFSNIIGVYSMPDGTILSGSDWGNILVWNEGCIEIEVRRKSKKSCHRGMITQFKYSNGELMSVGVDGWIRVWYYDTIGQANSSPDDRYLEMEPIYEFRIGAESDDDDQNQKKYPMLMAIEKKDPDDLEETFWYAQDGNGGLWLIDLSTNQLQKPSEKIFTCHAGAITNTSVCPWGNYIVSCGEGGHLNIYNYSSKNLIVSHYFKEICCQVIWLSCSIESTGSTLICGFQSGIVRVLVIDINQAESSSNKKNKEVEFDEESSQRNNFVRLISAVKPHKRAITVMIFNQVNRLLVTGSEDATVFCFSVDSSAIYPTLTPIGFISLPASITCIAWNPRNDEEILIGCSKGYFATTKLPDKPQVYTTVSYELSQCCPNIFQCNLSEEVAEKDKKSFDHTNNILTINYFTENKVWLTMSDNQDSIYEYSLENNSNNEKEAILKLNPTKIKGVGTKDEEITSCLFYNITKDDENIKYLIIGTEKGKIQVCKIKDWDSSDLSDYWILQMHDNLNGSITKICLSYDKQFLFTSGNDGNIFSYLINEGNSSEVIKNENPARLTVLPENIEDIEDDDHPSLEEVIRKAEQNRMEAEMKRKKEKTLDTLRNLNEEYREIMNRNRKLPKSQQIPLEEFELDSRITEDSNKQLKQEIDSVHNQMAFQVEKSTLTLKKLIDYFIKPITCVPFAVCKVLKPSSMVHSIKVKALDDEFYDIYNQVHKQIEETKLTSLDTSVKLKKDEAKIVDKEEETEDEDKEDYKIQEVESFLRGLNSDTIKHKLGVQIYQILRKYRERKAQMEQKAKEWKVMYASKPDLKADHEEDIEAIEEAKRTIGDYKLKIADNVSGDMEAKQTTLLKHQQLLECKKENYLLKERFNEKLKQLRDNKLKLQKEVINLVEELNSIHAEIPDKYQKPLPKVFDINWDVEFPEKNLELEKYIPMSEKIKEARQQKQLLILEEPVLQNLASIDEEYEVLLSDETAIDLHCKLPRFLSNYPIHQTIIDVPQNLIDSLNASDRVQTSWEVEMKLARMIKKIYRQECILNYITDNYKSIDEQLDELEEERLQIQAEEIYSDLFQCTLQQELIILRNFEMKENILTLKVKEDLENRSEIQRRINDLAVNLEHKVKEITRLNDKIKDLTVQFNNMVNDNKFTEFLKRVYKKKYREIRISDELSDSTSSESIDDKDDDEDDEDDLEDNFSDEDQNIKLAYLDDNYCPAGCDEELFKATISMRKKRHDYEAKVRDDQKIVEGLKKDIEQEHKRLKMVESTLNVSQRELQDYMREKQKQLNNIDVTVVLKLHQLQHFINEETLAKIQDCVVFDQNQLSKLYTRVGELQQETLDQKTKHEKNKNHLHRLELDCKYMESEIKRLKTEIKDEMSRKFGREISLIKLYEAVLRRMIFDIRADITDETKVYDKRINEVKAKYHQQILVLENLIKENTEKLNILTTLEEEQHKLRKILRKTPETVDNIMRIKNDYEEDLRKLEEILQHQKNQKELFKYEIRNLRLKTRSLPPIYPQGKVFDLHEDKMTDFGELHERDFYASPENDEEIGKKDELLPKIINKSNDQNILNYKMDFGISKDEAEEINWNIELKVEELLDLLGIKADPTLKINIIKYLKHENGVKMAVDSISTKLSSSSIEITTALKDYAFHVLRELKKNISSS
ncbi:cilia- and flagella-associated protein 44 [Chelonus insularis]|uniref:cilia- and flagella-associated protein 44 n=1 Tax=Chelonus insularis TaxID=460826 RepID=UPI00158D508D|nr:cilia- and flagella-associated protein 44 [Chelonus insularis]